MTEQNDTGCCGSPAKDNIEYRSVDTTGYIKAGETDIPVVSTEWRARDYIGAIAVRLDINRMDYAVSPGLYAVGSPGKDSPVMVSANYKLSFDVLRRELKGLNAWILVLDTKGVNVWCAAGKGTFGTMEIVRRVMMAGLEKVVNTKKLIVPQLGAPGVSAHMVSAFCGFNVVYGPVKAGDIKKYLEAGMKASPAMRRIDFGMNDRIIVAFLETAVILKKGIAVSALFFILGGLSSKGFSFAGAWEKSSLIINLLWAAIFSGTILTGALLPYVPGKAFSFKGGLLGAAAAVGILIVRRSPLLNLSSISLILFASAVSAFLALNYTGSTTFTSLSGVKKEIKYALPAVIAMIGVSGILQLIRLLGRM